MLIIDFLRASTLVEALKLGQLSIFLISSGVFRLFITANLTLYKRAIADIKSEIALT